MTTRIPGARPLVALVVPAFNEEASISACLDSICAQSWRELDIVVVDGGSTDATRAIVADFAAHDDRVRLIDNPGRTQPAAMNTSLAHIDAEWLVRVDAHSTVPPGYVEGVMAHLMTGSWGGVGGRKDGVAYTDAGRAIVAALGSRFGVGNSTYHHGTETQVVDHIPFGAYPTEVARSIGGWDEAITANEDYEFDYRVRQSGRELLFDPSLVIFWETRQDVRAFFRQYRRYGQGKALVLAKHPESAAIRHLIPGGLVAALVLAAVVLPFRPRWATALVAPYVAVIAAATVTTAAALDSSQSRRLLPAAFSSMHVGYGLGFWESMLGVLIRRGRPRRETVASAVV